jgi:hypothetical protein
MLKDSIKMTGELKLTLTNEKGDITKEVIVPNTVVTVGKGFIASRMKDATATAMSHMELGTSTASTTATMTTLTSIVSGSRTALTSTTVTTNSVAYVVTFPAGTGTGALTEAGIFNASSAGTMLCRTTFSVINKAAADTLGITWTVTVN